MKRRQIMAKDPVCGMDVDEKKAVTAVCKATFERAPKYAGK
jgi:hypothetical protein